MFFSTHFVDKAIISEFRKIKNTPNVDSILAIDNTSGEFEFKNRVENRIFFGTSCNCFFFDSALNEEMKLPNFAYYERSYYENFGNVMWNNCDYKFYYVKKYFSEYDYYWQIEYDVFCNAATYESFLNRFAESRADLLITHFRVRKKSDSGAWTQGLDWIYDTEEIYGSIFPVVRMSANAIDFLYKRRLEHKEIFKNSTDENKRWVGNEIFAPTELMNNGFSCEKIEEPHIKAVPVIYLNDERFFLKPDNQLYHPVKTIGTKIEKMRDRYDKLYFAFRKVFLSQLVEKLISISNINLKNFLIKFDDKFNFVSMILPNKEGGTELDLRYEAHFINEELYIVLVFDGKYTKDFHVIRQCLGLNRLQPLKQLKIPGGKAVTYIVPTFDDVSVAANAMKILIESTYNVLLEKVLS